jgi:hypothetical protein
LASNGKSIANWAILNGHWEIPAAAIQVSFNFTMDLAETEAAEAA